MTGPNAGANCMLQVLLLLNVWVTGPLWFIITLSLLIYKGSKLPFTSDYSGANTFAFEIVGAIFILIVQIIAFSYGRRGNLTQIPVLLIISAVTHILLCLGLTYYLWYQTYVMRLDFTMTLTFMISDGLCVFLSFWAVSDSSTYQAQGFGGNIVARPDRMEKQHAVGERGAGLHHAGPRGDVGQGITDPSMQALATSQNIHE